MKISIDMDAICVKCGRKGAVTSMERDGDKVGGKVCLDCLADHLKKKGQVSHES